ncbi:hypothetical protein BDV59DRAFT_11260 [Aspergillus ambiguus]|uniref:uncharacterized protein n=1 Tax=Aspergillus ambiguus TaxID=176160 RepID=UPI003CCD8530
MILRTIFSSRMGLHPLLIFCSILLSEYARLHFLVLGLAHLVTVAGLHCIEFVRSRSKAPLIGVSGLRWYSTVCNHRGLDNPKHQASPAYVYAIALQPGPSALSTLSAC